MKFGSWTYDGLRLDMVPERTDGKCAGDIKKFIRHGEWDLTSMLCARQELVYECCPEPYPDITYTLELRRRHMFYFVNMIAPCFLISGLFDFSFFFFVINSDSLRLHWYQGKSFHIRHGTFKYRISVSGLHTKHESSLKCSHIRHKSGLWIRNPKWKLRIRTLWLRNFRSCSWVIPWIRIVYFPSGLRLTLPFRWCQVALTPNWPIYLQEWFSCRIQYFFLVTFGPINGINSFFNSFDSAVILSAAWIRWAPDTRDHKSSSIDGLHVVGGGNNSSDFRDGAAHLDLLLWKRLWSK